jgi:hypothetical protein
MLSISLPVDTMIQDKIKEFLQVNPLSIHLRAETEEVFFRIKIR